MQQVSDVAGLSARQAALHRFVPASPMDTHACEEMNSAFDIAVSRGASDIHIEHAADDIVVRLRVNGLLSELKRLPTHMALPLFARIRQRSKMDTIQTRAPADGTFSVYAHDQLVSARVSVIPGLHGPITVMRILYSRTRATLDSLPFSPLLRDAVQGALEKNEGLILLTGPTGSGKTTSLYAMLDRLNTPERAISTVEDPVEYQVPGLRQVPVTPDTTFEKALRALLRQDPDAMLIGEIRDRVTAAIALQAANTGHLTLSSTHTNSAPATISRLLNLGCEGYDIAVALELVIAQRLLPVLCPACALRGDQREEGETSHYDADGMTQLETHWINKNNLGRYRTQPFARASRHGCDQCHRTGYKGRIPIFSAIARSDAMQNAITAAAPEGIERAARQQALYEPLIIAGIRLAVDGQIPISALMQMQSVSTAVDAQIDTPALIVAATGVEETNQ